MPLWRKTSLSRGDAAENLALKLLKQAGLTFKLRNYSVHNVGELDLVMYDHAQATMIVIEVRYRKHQDFGGAAITVSRAKQQRIIRTTQHLMQAHPEWADMAWRFDVVSFDGTVDKAAFNWIQSAFDAS